MFFFIYIFLRSMASTFSLMPFLSFSSCRAAERPCGSDSVSGKRGCGPGEKPPPAVAPAGLLLQLGLPRQQLRLWKQWRREGLYVRAHRYVGCDTVPTNANLHKSYQVRQLVSANAGLDEVWHWLGERISFASPSSTNWRNRLRLKTKMYTRGSLVFHIISIKCKYS